MTAIQPVVRISDIREARLCMRGARKWFENYGLSWSDFLANGISADDLEATGDPLAFRVTKITRREFANGRRG